VGEPRCTRFRIILLGGKEEKKLGTRMRKKNHYELAARSSDRLKKEENRKHQEGKSGYV